MVGHSGPFPAPTTLIAAQLAIISHKLCSTLDPDLPALGPRTQHPVAHWLLLESDHLNPNLSLYHGMGLEQPVPSVCGHCSPTSRPSSYSSVLYIPLPPSTKLLPSCLTRHTAGCMACSELPPLPTAPCSPEGSAHSLSRTCCPLRTMAFAFWRRLQCLTPTFVAVSSSAHPQTLVVHQ